MLAESKRDGELEAAFAQWTDMLVKTDVKMGRLGKGRYDERVRTLEAEAQSDMEELVESYAEALPDDLASLTGSEVYKILSMWATLDSSGVVELGGVVAFPQSKDHIETCPKT